MQDFWDIATIKQVLPKDYPFLFIDRVVEIDRPGQRVRCIKNITLNEYFLSGHFPAKAIMPGAIVVEAAYQAAIILKSALSETNQPKFDYFLNKVEAEFFNKLNPGDQLSLDAAVIENSQEALTAKVLVSVGEQKTAELIVFLKIGKGR